MGVLQKSSEVMKTVNGLVNVGQVSAVMMEMSKEMVKVIPSITYLISRLG